MLLCAPSLVQLITFLASTQCVKIDNGKMKPAAVKFIVVVFNA
jgi:hypothetical protein